MSKVKEKNCRLGKVGGQAVIEGVMMKSGDNMAIASRMPDKSIKLTRQVFASVRKKNKILNFPIIRGVINFVEMMTLSYKTMDIAADALGLEEEEPSKFEKWLAKTFNVGITTFVMVIGVILGLCLSVALFIFLPSAAGSGISWLISLISGGRINIAGMPILFSVIEGILKIAIFLAYLALISLMKDIKRVFQYHGAEHKSVFCYENNDELTVENVKKYKRFHPRCGTSFMFFMILIGIIIGCFIPRGVFLRPLIKVLLLPLTVGIGYEIIMLAGKHENFFTKAISAPGLWVQRLTTKEPDDSQIECAIAALKGAIPAEFPGYAPPKPVAKAAVKAAAKVDAEPEAVITASGGMRRVAAMTRRIEAAGDAHLRVKLRGMTKGERASYLRRNK